MADLHARQQQAVSEAAELREQLEVERRGYRSLKEDFLKEHELWKLEKRAMEGHISTLKVRIPSHIVTIRSDHLYLHQDTERRVVCLIDGDGTIFSPSYLAQGQVGGLNAAQILVEHIREYLLKEDSLSSSSYELFIYCFLHKKGLVETLAKAGYADASEHFDEFVAGFNQAGHRFLMVDVGYGKENADSKLRGKNTLFDLLSPV